jgi:hypothetical protein
MTIFKLNPIVATQYFHLTPVSANVKTGPIPVSTTTRESCSPVCPFFNNGCYAETGPLRLHWNAVTAQARGFTYTHHDIGLGDNLGLIELANVGGFTVNLSANDLDHADTLADTGLPVCVVLPVTQDENLVTPAGRRVVICPAIARDDGSCATCQLCARADRTVIVGFPAHGTGVKKADSVARRVITIAPV